MPDKAKPSKLLMGMMSRMDQPEALPTETIPTPTKVDTSNLNAWHITLSEKANPQPTQPQPTGKYRPSNEWAAQGAPTPVPPAPDTSKDDKIKEILDKQDATDVETSKTNIGKRVARLNNIGKILVNHANIRGVAKETTFIGAKTTFDNFTKMLEQKGGEALAHASPEQMKLLERIQDTLLAFVNSDGKDYDKFSSRMRDLIGRSKSVPGSAKTNEFLGSLAQASSAGISQKPKSLFSIVTDKYFGDIKQLKTGKDWFEEKSVIGQYLRRNEGQASIPADISGGQLAQEQENLRAESRGKGTTYTAKPAPAVSEMEKEIGKEEGHYQEHVSRKETGVLGKKSEDNGIKSISGVLGKILVELQDIKEALLLGEAGAAITGGHDDSSLWDKAKNVFKRGTPAAAAGVGSTGMMLGTVGSVALGGAMASYGATGVMASPIQEANRKALQENPMLGAMSGDTGMASAILDANQGKEPEQIRAEQAKERAQLKDAPWYTRIYGIGKSDYLKEQSKTMLNQAPEQLSELNKVAVAKDKAPVIIQTPPSQTTSAPANNTQTVPIKASPRSNDSSFQDWAKNKMQGW